MMTIHALFVPGRMDGHMEKHDLEVTGMCPETKIMWKVTHFIAKAETACRATWADNTGGVLFLTTLSLSRAIRRDRAPADSTLRAWA